ncbi:TetR/AcrR family transcriptional regulator [Nisaea sp.]|uniref:TetR/AcrR family transcriptional regulator n=1 Tax=Nisaea sp. TaxID=2024842 RepID=UPI003B52F74F
MRDGTTGEQIVERADDLFYRQGFERTSFADIAAEVGISRGNFYYHFRTKDEILDAVIEARIDASREMIAGWEAETDDPEARILGYIRILRDNRQDIMAYGCPVGTLTSELAKLNHRAQDAAGRIFTLFRDWLRGEFERLGCGGESDRNAMHVLAWSQGVATMANAYQDADFVEREISEISDWLHERAAEART